MNNNDLRVDLILKITHGLKTAKGHNFDREFYKEMMTMKDSGQDLWFTQGEEDFYRGKCSWGDISKKGLCYE
jgi:hypothetical protein